MSSSNREFRLVAPPADGLAEAFRAAAARRRRKAATTGGAGVTAAVLVLAALTGTSGQVLTQEPAPPARQTTPDLLETGPGPAPDSVPQDAVEPIERSREDDAVPAGTAGTRTAPAVPVAPRSAARTSAGDRAPGAPGGSSAEGPRSGYRPGPVERSYSTPYLPSECLGDLDLCSEVRPGNRTSGGETVQTLRFTLCNAATTAVLLRFADRDELELVVRDSKGRVAWRWSTGRPGVADPHNVRLAGGRCLYWTTDWPQVDSSGRPLPKGDYTLVGTLATRDAGAARTNESPYTAR